MSTNWRMTHANSPPEAGQGTAKRHYEQVANLQDEERDRLVMEHLPLVQFIARRIHDRLPQHVPLEDLVNAGVVGLLEALRHYDPSKNAELKTYAKIRIQGAILDSLRDLDWSPRSLRRKAREVEQATRKLRATLGYAPSEPEIAQEMGMPLDEFNRLLTDLRGLDLGSLQALNEDSEGGDRAEKYLPNSPDTDPLFICLRSELRECLARAVSELPERERQLMALYYVEELTMKEIGMVLGLGEGRISQLHSAALIRLRARMQELLGSRPAKKARA